MTQEELNNLKELAGQVRGVVFETDVNYVKNKIGEDGMKKMQEKTKEIGWEIDYQNIKTLGWYPVGLRIVSLLAVKEAFGWGDKEIQDMGNCAPKYSFIATTMLKYFLSVTKVFKESTRYWQKHYTVGSLEAFDIKEEEKHATLRLKDFKIHPILCAYYIGYFLRISQFVIRSEKITCQETECVFKGGSCHQFLVKWV
jgi:hypothetical protein